MTDWQPTVVMKIERRLDDGCVLAHTEEGGPGLSLTEAADRCERWLAKALRWHEGEYVHVAVPA